MPRVLIVEDDDAMSTALRDGFGFEGWEVTASERVPFISGVDVLVTTYERP